MPLILSHDHDKTVGALWLNSAETYIDIWDTRDNVSVGSWLFSMAPLTQPSLLLTLPRLPNRRAVAFTMRLIIFSRYAHHPPSYPSMKRALTFVSALDFDLTAGWQPAQGHALDERVRHH